MHLPREEPDPRVRWYARQIAIELRQAIEDVVSSLLNKPRRNKANLGVNTKQLGNPVLRGAYLLTDLPPDDHVIREVRETVHGDSTGHRKRMLR